MSQIEKECAEIESFLNQSDIKCGMNCVIDGESLCEKIGCPNYRMLYRLISLRKCLER